MFVPLAVEKIGSENHPRGGVLSWALYGKTPEGGVVNQMRTAHYIHKGAQPADKKLCLGFVFLR